MLWIIFQRYWWYNWPVPPLSNCCNCNVLRLRICHTVLRLPVGSADAITRKTVWRKPQKNSFPLHELFDSGKPLWSLRRQIWIIRAHLKCRQRGYVPNSFAGGFNPYQVLINMCKRKCNQRYKYTYNRTLMCPHVRGRWFTHTYTYVQASEK